MSHLRHDIRMRGEEIVTFLTATAGDAEQGWTELRALRPGRRPIREAFWVAAPGWVERAAALALEWSRDRNVYVGNALRSTRESGRDQDVLRGRVVSVEIDTDRGLVALAAFPIEATFTIASGGLTESGSARVHAHWIVSDWMTPEQIRDLQHRLRDHLHGDPANNPTQGAVWRLPALTNHKHNRFARLTTHRGPSRPVALFEEHLPKRPDTYSPATPKRAPVALDADRESAIEAACAFAWSQIAAGASRNGSGFELACALRDRGLDEPDREPILIDFAERVREAFPDREPYTDAEIRASNRSASTRPPRKVQAAPAGLAAWGDRALEVVRERHPRTRTLDQLILRLVALAEHHGTDKVVRSERKLAEDVARRARKIGPALQDLERLRLIRKRIDPKTRATLIELKISNADRKRERDGISPNNPSLARDCSCSVAPLSAPVPLGHDAQAYRALGQGFPTLLALQRSSGPMTVSEIVSASGLTARTVRRHLARAAADGIVRAGPDGRWQLDSEDLGVKLDAAAVRYGTQGRADRISARHARQRKAFALYERRCEDRMRRIKRRRRSGSDPPRGGARLEPADRSRSSTPTQERSR